MDTDFFQDRKIKLVRGNFGAKGIVVVLALFCQIYKENGYFLRWSDDDCALLADGLGGCGIRPETVREVVSGCLEWGLFDRAVFLRFGALTSRGIQRRYLRMWPKRLNIPMYQEYWLLSDASEEEVPASISIKVALFSIEEGKTPVIPGKTPVITGNNAIKKSKVKEKEYEEYPPIVGYSSCTEPKNGPVPPAILLPLNDGSEYPVTEEQCQKWAGLYPAVDVMQQLRHMKGWLEANPGRRKTKRGILRFIHSWLSREQDKGWAGKGAVQKSGGQKVPSFDLDAFERDSLSIPKFPEKGG